MNQTETEYSLKVQIALLSFDFGLAETHERSRELYLEEFEPAQVLSTCTIDGSGNSSCRLPSISREHSSTLQLTGPSIANCSLYPDRIIGKSVL